MNAVEHNGRNLVIKIIKVTTIPRMQIVQITITSNSRNTEIISFVFIFSYGLEYLGNFESRSVIHNFYPTLESSFSSAVNKYREKEKFYAFPGVFSKKTNKETLTRI